MPPGRLALSLSSACAGRPIAGGGIAPLGASGPHRQQGWLLERGFLSRAAIIGLISAPPKTLEMRNESRAIEATQQTLRIGPAHARGKIRDSSKPRLVEGTSVDKTKALDAALSQIERAFGKGSVMRLGKPESGLIDTVLTGRSV